MFLQRWQCVIDLAPTCAEVFVSPAYMVELFNLMFATKKYLLNLASHICLSMDSSEAQMLPVCA